MYKEDLEQYIKQLKKELFFTESEEKKEELKQLIKEQEEELIFTPTREDYKEWREYTFFGY